MGRTLENYMIEDIPAASATLDQTDGILCLEDDEIKLAAPPQVNNAALWLPGSSGNYVSAPDAAALDIVGDICIVAKVALDDWTPADYNTVVSKHVTTGNQISWSFRVDAVTGFLCFFSTSNGAVGTVAVAVSTAAPSVSNGGALWLAVTVDADNGSSVSVYHFWTSDDGETWTQLGDIATAAVIAIHAGTAPLTIGGVDAGTTSLLVGKVYSVSVRSGIGASGVVGGTEVASYDADLARGQRYRDAYGNLFTANGSAWALMAA
jgi:hypothetical protein